MALCTANKANGEPCALSALSDRSTCWAHSPENATVRSKNSSKGGKTKTPVSDLRAMKARIKGYMDAVEEKKLDKGTASILSQLAGTYLNALRVELKATEQLDLKLRLEELEATIEAQRHEGGSWYVS